LGVENYCYVAVCSVALGVLVPTEGGEGWGHIVAAAHLQLAVIVLMPKVLSATNATDILSVFSFFLAFICML